jgi:uncharacterized phage protein gp47/JayE
MPLPAFETYDEILTGMVGKVVTNTPLSDVSNSSALMSILAAAARSDSKIAFEALKVLQLFSIDTCTGDDLERRAAEIFPASTGGAIERLAASKATGTIIFTRTQTGVAIEVASGTQVQTADGQVFATTELGTIAATDEASVPVKILALEPGSTGNVQPGSITQFANKPQGVNSVRNDDPTLFGEDRESDDSFRERIRLWIQSLDHCTVGAVEAAVLGAKDPATGIVCRFAQVVEPVNNPGFATCYIDDGTGTADTLGSRVRVENENITDYPGNSGTAAEGGEANLYLRNKPIYDVDFEITSTTRGALARGPQPVGQYMLNPSNGQVAFDPPLVTGERVFVNYWYHTGLIAECQKIIDGDPEDRISYPGYRAAGCNVQIKAPTPRTIDVTATLVLEDGYEPAVVRVQATDAVSSYINTLGIGRDVIFNEVVAAIMEVPGVIDINPLEVNSSIVNIIVTDGYIARTATVVVN